MGVLFFILYFSFIIYFTIWGCLLHLFSLLFKLKRLSHFEDLSKGNWISASFSSKGFKKNTDFIRKSVGLAIFFYMRIKRESVMK